METYWTRFYIKKNIQTYIHTYLLSAYVIMLPMWESVISAKNNVFSSSKFHYELFKLPFGHRIRNYVKMRLNMLSQSRITLPMCSAYCTVAFFLENLLISQCSCDFSEPLSAVLTTQALSDHTSLPRALHFGSSFIQRFPSMHPSLSSTPHSLVPCDCLLHSLHCMHFVCIYKPLWVCWPSAVE